MASFFDKLFQKQIDASVTSKLKRIQAGAEGETDLIELEALMYATSVNGEGLENPYKTYDSQVVATYEKYNGLAELGNWLTRTIVDTRTGFISGEGLSVVSKDTKLSEFFDELLTDNRLKGSRFHNMVKAGEMEGRQLLTVAYSEKTKKIKVISKNSNFSGGENYKVYLEDSNDVTDIKKVTIVDNDGTTEKALEGDFTYVKLGGDPSKVNETSTRVGVVLQQIDNYSRGLNIMRKNNHLFARVTPFFKTETQKDATTLLSTINKLKWKVGSAFAGPAELKLLVPEVGAMENIQAELLAITKAISAVSGVPIHWFGYVDAMSNRSVADNLFEAISNATIQERSVWAETFYDILLKAQQVAIDNGRLKGTVNRDFEVKIPLISFAHALTLVKNLSMAYHDKVISKSDYQNALPGIDPYKTNVFLEQEEEEREEEAVDELDTGEEIVDDIIGDKQTPVNYKNIDKKGVKNDQSRP